MPISIQITTVQIPPYTQISDDIGDCNQMLSNISDQNRKPRARAWLFLRILSNSNSSLSSQQTYVQRLQNSLALFSHPKIKGFGVECRGDAAQQNGHWQSAARRAATQVECVSAAAAQRSYPQYCRVRRSKQTLCYFAHCEKSSRLIFSFWV